MTYRIEKYVTELTPILKEQFENEENLIISAPTSSGKTTAILDYAKAHPSKKIAFLAPTQSLTDNIKKNNPSLYCGYGFEFLERVKHTNLVVTTYDSLIKLPQQFDMVFVDEAHLLAGHGDFRTEVLANILKCNFKLILLTGTPEIIVGLNGFKMIEIEKKNPVKWLQFVKATESAKTYIHHIISNRNRKKLTLIRINDKSLIDEIHQHYSNSINIVRLYSEESNVLYEGQNERIINEVKSGKVNPSVEVMLCTSIIDAGISLEVYKDVDAYAIDDKNLPNPIDTVQLYARVRPNTGHEMNLTVIGKFGNASIPKQITFDEDDDAELNLLYMNSRYSRYSHLDEENYINFLNKYSIRFSEVLLTKVVKAEPFKRCGAYQIVSNLKGLNPAKYEQIATKLSDTEKKLIAGTKAFSNIIRVDVERFSNKIALAVEYEVPLSHLINNGKYYQEKAKALIEAVEYYRNSRPFANVMHQLLEGYELSKGDSFKMNLYKYSLLSTPQQTAIKQVASLIYHHSNWTRKTIKLKRIKHHEGLNNYFLRLLYKNVKRPCTSIDNAA